MSTSKTDVNFEEVKKMILGNVESLLEAADDIGISFGYAKLVLRMF